jgi:hypothetical protein
MRNSRLGHIQSLRDITDTELALQQYAQDAHSGGISEALKQLGQIV